MTPRRRRWFVARDLQSLGDFRLLGGVYGRNGNTHTPPERCPMGYQRRADPPLAHYRPLSRGEGPPCLQGCRHHVYAPLRKSCSLGRRTSSYLRRRRWRTFKVTPSGMPWTYVLETPRNKVDIVLRCVRRAPALDGRACRAPRSPRCHRASARPCRVNCLCASAVDAGGSDDLGRFVCHVSNRRGNPTLTFLEGGGPCIHTCRAESMHR